MSSWFLINCKANQDDKAERHLQEQDFEVFRPKVEVRGRGRRRGSPDEKPRLESLFPSYLFLCVDPQVKSIAPVSSTPGVNGPVRFGSAYALASADLIEQLKADVERLSSGGAHTWEQGQSIYVDRAGFESVQAIYCNPRGAERSAILVGMLGQQTRVVVPTRCIRAA